MQRGSSAGNGRSARSRTGSHRSELLCLVGPSGCGKSSLIEAGVLADLESTEPVHWTVRTLRPGGSPMRSLGEALGAGLDETTTPEAVGRAARRAIASPGQAARLLLVVDQLEELFAQASADERARFIAALAAIHELEDASIVLAIRADFYGELMESALWPLVEGGKVDVPPLAGDALAEAIAEPAKACHVTIEPDLLERLVADAGNEPGALPLLQEALVRLWGSMHLHRISLAAYETGRRRRPRWTVCRRRRDGGRRVRGSLARSGADRQARAAAARPVRARSPRHAPPAPVRGPPERGRRRPRARGRARHSLPARAS